jgi:hypothetical protein
MDLVWVASFFGFGDTLLGLFGEVGDDRFSLAAPTLGKIGGEIL